MGKRGSGWKGESQRHRMSAYGVKTTSRGYYDLPKKRKTWKDKLTKAQRKHLAESGITTKYQLEEMKEHLKGKKISDWDYCYDCRKILEKLDMWDELDASGIPNRTNMVNYLWHRWNDINPNATNEEVRKWKKFYSEKTDEQVRESYDRQIAINRPLTKKEHKEIDIGIDSLFKIRED